MNVLEIDLLTIRKHLKERILVHFPQWLKFNYVESMSIIDDSLILVVSQCLSGGESLQGEQSIRLGYIFEEFLKVK